MNPNDGARMPLPERAPEHTPKLNPLRTTVHPDRETVINGDDVLNLRIALETMTLEELVEVL